MRAISRAAALAATLVVATACAASAPTRYHESTRALERAGTRTVPVADDPFAGHGALERDALVRAVLERNPTIHAARHAWGAALRRYPQVTAYDDPMLGYGAAPRSFGARGIDDGHVVDLSQAIPFPGKLGLRGEAALAEAEAMRGDYEAVRLRLATMASMLFDDHWLATRALAINAQHVALLESFQRIALARYEVGRATQQDPLQAEAELARLLQRDLEYRARLRVIRQQINTLLHRSTDAPLPPAPATLIPPALPFAELTTAPLAEAALVTRPEIEAAQARVRAREVGVGVARREFFPDFTLVGNYNRRMPVSEVRPFVGLRLNVPLQLGRRRAALQEARARLASAQSAQARISDEVALAVHESVAEYERARAVAALLDRRLLPAGRDRVGAARAGFESGRNSFLELVDAERELRRIELDREAAQADLSRRAAQLLRAVGRLPAADGVQP